MLSVWPITAAAPRRICTGFPFHFPKQTLGKTSRHTYSSPMPACFKSGLTFRGMAIREESDAPQEP
jgi:hypothetical protein